MLASRGGRREKVKIERKEKGGGGETPNSIQLGSVCTPYIYICLKALLGPWRNFGASSTSSRLWRQQKDVPVYTLSLSLLIPPHHHQFFFLTLFFFYTESCSRLFTCVSLSKLAGSWYIYNNWKVSFLIYRERESIRWCSHFKLIIEYR